MKLSDRIMKCDCGVKMDRDKNSAINIMSRFLSQNARWMGYQQFAGNLQTIVTVRKLKDLQEAPAFKQG